MLQKSRLTGLIILIFIFSSFKFTDKSPTISLKQPETESSCMIGCEDYENMGIPAAELGNWYESFGIMDGTFYYTDVEFHDGVKGRLFQGGNSKKYFVESAEGRNYYYINLKWQ